MKEGNTQYLTDSGIFVHYIKVTYEDDWEKLLIIIKYIQETRDENLTLKTNNMTMID